MVSPGAIDPPLRDDAAPVAGFVSTRRPLPEGYPRPWSVVGEAKEFALRNPGSPPWLAPLIGLTITGWVGFGIVLVMLWRAG